METRELFWGLGASGKLIFYVIGFVAIAAFVLGFARYIVKYRRGRPLPAPLDLVAGVRRMVADLGTHRGLRRRDRYAGLAHAAIFFGFALLFVGTATITLEYDILEPLFGVTFWKGNFFLLFGLTLDLAGLALVAGLVLMMVRRAAFALPKLDYLRAYRGETELRPAAKRWKVEDWVFLIALLAIALSGFVQEGVRHAMERPAWGAWEPVGAALGGLFGATLSQDGIAALRAANWWLHGFAALAFIVALPWWKARHILAVLGSLAARDPLALRRLPRQAEDAAAVGVATIADLSWKDMLDLDACTKCGRCHDACPARASGYPLSPRDLILDLRVHNDVAQGKPQAGVDLIGAVTGSGVIDPETLWSCRTCGACQEICPVGVEHPVKIVQMRRQLVERGELDPLLKTTLDTIANTGNSFGENGRKRAAWTRELDFPVKDIRKETAELLWFVGDYASFDPRNQRVSRTFARLLRAAKQDFALLHEGERTAGNDVRRVGEEGLFESLVEHNLGQMGAAQPFKRIVTTDPHSFNTLKNEYPEFGPTAPVSHYTEVLCELLEAGVLKVKQPLGLRVTFHDPCHLGRLNKRYDAPRRVLELIGCELVEMPRNRDNSFCCGAGGGRIWIPDKPGTSKPSESRVHEAAGLGGIDVFVTCCPKDLTMFEDARKTAGHEKDFVVEDIAELVARAIELESLKLADLPDFAERLTSAVADRVAQAVGARLDAILAARPVAMQAAVVPVRPVVAEASVPGITDGPVAAAVPAAPAFAGSGPAWQIRPVLPVDLPGYEVPPCEGPRILVTVKHVGKLGDEFRFTSDGRGIDSEFFEYQLNEFDDVALEEALQLIEKTGRGEVVVVTVGPAEAEETLRKALAKGAHRGVRVWDDSLVGADPIAVARLLAGVALKEQPCLIIGGVQSSDMANGATGVALARLLGWPRAAVVVATEWDGGERMTVTRELEGGLRHRFSLALPALLTMQTGANTPRYATMRMQKQAKSKPIAEVAAGTDDAWASAWVERLAEPPETRATMLNGTPDEVAAQVLQIVRDKMGANA